MKKNKKKKGKLLIRLGVFLLIIGIFFLSYFKIKIENQTQRAINLEKKMLEDRNRQETSPVSKGTEINSLTENKYKGVDTVDNGAIGVIRIDKIGIVLPIYNNASNQSLLDGAGLVETTDLPSSNKNTITVLAGHRGSRKGLKYFLNIQKLAIDDEIKITTRKEILYYKVTGEEVIEADDWSKFIREEEKTKLYLMSCHPYPLNYQRLLIKSELVKKIDL